MSRAITLSAQIIVGQKVKLKSDELEDLVDALLDMFPNMEDAEVTRYEKNFKQLARFIFEKKMKPVLPLQVAARQYLDRLETKSAPQKLPVVLPTELYSTTPHTNIFNVFSSLTASVVSVGEKLANRHHVNVHESVFNRLLEQYAETISDIIVELRDDQNNFYYLRIVGVTQPGSDINLVETRDLQGKFYIKLVKDLAMVEKIEFFTESNLPESANRMMLEAYMRGMPAVHIGQTLRINDMIKFKVVGLRPEYGYLKLPFDGNVEYEIVKQDKFIINDMIPDVFDFKNISRKNLFDQYGDYLAKYVECLATKIDLNYAPKDWVEKHDLEKKIIQRDTPKEFCFGCKQQNATLKEERNELTFCGESCQKTFYVDGNLQILQSGPGFGKDVFIQMVTAMPSQRERAAFIDAMILDATDKQRNRLLKWISDSSTKMKLFPHWDTLFHMALSYSLPNLLFYTKVPDIPVSESEMVNLARTENLRVFKNFLQRTNSSNYMLLYLLKELAKGHNIIMHVQKLELLKQEFDGWTHPFFDQIILLIKEGTKIIQNRNHYITHLISALYELLDKSDRPFRQEKSELKRLKKG